MLSDSRQAGFWINVKEITILLIIVWLVRTWGFGLYQVPTGSMETTMLVGERFFADKFTPLFSTIQRGEVIAFNDPTYDYSNNFFARFFQEYVWGASNWTKRVIAMPGDTIKGVIEDGKPVIYLNGKKLVEPYINKYPLVRIWKIDPRQVAKYVGNDKDKAWDFVSIKSFDPYVSLENQSFYSIQPERIIMERSEPSVIYPGTAITPRSDFRPEEVGRNYWTGSDEFYVKLDKNQYWVMGDNRLGSKDSRWFGPIDGRLIHGRIKYRIWSVDSDESWWPVDLIKHPINFWHRVRWKRFFQKVV